MARIEWVKLRLNNWALWCAREAGGGLGFATQSAFLNDAAGHDERQAKIPVDEIDASVTNDAVEALKIDRPQIYAVLQCMYRRGLGVEGTCRKLECKRANVYALLDVGDRVLSAWFTERSEKQAKLREAIKKSFTT